MSCDAACGNPAGNVLVIDMFTLFREVTANPGVYGTWTVRGVACTTPTSGQCTPATTLSGAAETYLFADNIHPTCHTLFNGQLLGSNRSEGEELVRNKIIEWPNADLIARDEQAARLRLEYRQYEFAEQLSGQI